MILQYRTTIYFNKLLTTPQCLPFSHEWLVQPIHGSARVGTIFVTCRARPTQPLGRAFQDQQLQTRPQRITENNKHPKNDTTQRQFLASRNLSSFSISLQYCKMDRALDEIVSERHVGLPFRSLVSALHPQRNQTDGLLAARWWTRSRTPRGSQK